MVDLPSLLLVSVGNTRTRFARNDRDDVQPAEAIPNAELPRLLAELRAAAADRRVMLASVNDPVADQVQAALEQAGGVVVRLGRTGGLPIPMEHALEHPVTVGQDRLLSALGAYSRSEQACVVIDAGTAVTVDFVDGVGVFQGGAIAPGVRMMLRAMHEHTAALPEVELSPSLLPAEGGVPFGRSTPQAMTIGAVNAVRGLAHTLIDRYAEFYEAYPRVIATGGDAALLFDNDPLVEHIVPDLTLVGMLAACRIALNASDDDEPEAE